MRISGWSSDVCSSDLRPGQAGAGADEPVAGLHAAVAVDRPAHAGPGGRSGGDARQGRPPLQEPGVGRERAVRLREAVLSADRALDAVDRERSEEHTSELQSLMRISYAVFCLKKNKH